MQNCVCKIKGKVREKIRGQNAKSDDSNGCSLPLIISMPSWTRSYQYVLNLYSVQVPDVEGSNENHCQLTKYTYGHRFKQKVRTYDHFPLIYLQINLLRKFLNDPLVYGLSRKCIFCLSFWGDSWIGTICRLQCIIESIRLVSWSLILSSRYWETGHFVRVDLVLEFLNYNVLHVCTKDTLYLQIPCKGISSF
mgnify:CR=1 FL=1